MITVAKPENQIPRAHSPLLALRMGNKPPVQDPHPDHQDAGDHHDQLVLVAHRLSERVRGAVGARRINDANLLHEKFFDQSGNGVYDKNHAERADQVPPKFFLFGYGPGLCPRIHHRGIEEAFAEKVEFFHIFLS